MKIGTKSLLFGIHQVFWHPYVVWRAWCYLYGHPSFKELICIIVHDWGYFGKPNLDGVEGMMHPKLGARIAGQLYGKKYYYLCSGHSRTYANAFGFETSKLCWADKLSFIFEPRWFYLLRARLSGELKEAREISIQTMGCSLTVPNKEWFNLAIEYFKNSIPKETMNKRR